MNSQNPSFSIDFITRKSKKNPSQAFIYARVTIDDDVKEVSLRQSISTEKGTIKEKLYPARTSSVQR